MGSPISCERRGRPRSALSRSAGGQGAAAGQRSKVRSNLPSYLTKQAVGAHPVPSPCLLKLVLVTNGVVKYCGSSTIVVTTNHVEPSFSLERSKYSRSVVLSL